MTTTPAANLDLTTGISRFVKLLLVLIPIVVGLAHQFLMFITRKYPAPIDQIPVILNPPGNVYPFVTLELGWWFVLTVVSAVFCLLVRARLLRPHRLIYPFYFYLVFLLILVKPIWPF